MTNSEAIEIIEEMRQVLRSSGYSFRAIKAFGMAIETLEKQVPKNPVGATDRNEMWVEGALLCPDCNTYFGEVFDEGYCRKCGRKLIQKRVRVIEAG